MYTDRRGAVVVGVNATLYFLTSRSLIVHTLELELEHDDARMTKYRRVVIIVWAVLPSLFVTPTPPRAFYD